MTTVDTLNVLYQLYNNMNNKFFKGELPEVFITIVHGKKKRGRVSWVCSITTHL